jgi:NitT/TauT family transport system ATP-binding protein
MQHMAHVAHDPEKLTDFSGKDHAQMQGTPLEQRAESAIEVAHVSHVYEGREGSVPALDDISMTVGAGRFVVIVGPSGCGKTSLLMMMAGLRRQSSGTIEIQGRPILEPDPDRVGVVFQEASLFPWLSALDNIEFPLALRHAPREERRKRALAMLNLVGLQGFDTRYPHELSGGMKQRVSIARGLVQDPPVLLMDEPFAALDEQTRMTMGHELLRIWSQTAKTVVFITHSLTEAVYLADEVLVMSARPGRIIDRITVTLPRPRTYEMMGTEVFGRLRDRIWQQIRKTV